MKDIKTYINENNDDINWANVKDVIETFEDYEWGENIELRDGDNEYYGTLDRLGSNKFFHEMMEIEKEGWAYARFWNPDHLNKKRCEKAYKRLNKLYDKPGSFFYDEKNCINFSPRVLSKYCDEIIQCIHF